MKNSPAPEIAPLLMLVLMMAIQAFGQENLTKPNDLLDQRITMQMEKQPLGLVFRNLIENYNVPIGFEGSTLDSNPYDYNFDTNTPSDQKLPPASENSIIAGESVFQPEEHWITVTAKNERLEEVLNVIVQQMQNYKWQINDGVVNIFPKVGRDKRLESLMELSIKDFNLEKGRTIGAISSCVANLPEFIQFLAINDLNYDARHWGVQVNLHSRLDRKVDFDLNFSNLRFRDLLNKITKTKRGGWIVRRSIFKGTKEKEYIDIEI